MHQSMLLLHPPSPETSTATRRARDYCDCYALLSLVCLLVRTPFWRAVLVDHKRRETGTTPQEVAGAELVPAPS